MNHEVVAGGRLRGALGAKGAQTGSENLRGAFWVIYDISSLDWTHSLILYAILTDCEPLERFHDV